MTNDVDGTEVPSQVTKNESDVLMNVFKSYMSRMEDNDSTVDALSIVKTFFEEGKQKLNIRVVVISLEEVTDLTPELLSLYVEQVDVLEIVPDAGYKIRYSLYIDGQISDQKSSHHTIKDPSLLAASSSHFLRTSTTGSDLDSFVIINRPEVNSLFVETITGALGCPFFLFFKTIIYNQSVLRLENAAEKCFVPDQGSLAEWNRAHVIGAQVLEMNEVGLVVGEVKLNLERAIVDDQTTAQSTDFDHRVLLVSYFSLPTSLVSTQRLNYWHQFLSKMAEEDDKPLEVVWLSATSRAAHLPRNRVVKDRGNHLVSPDFRQTLAQAVATGVPTLGMSWQDFVKKEVQHWEDSFDTVIISVGPFGYLELGEFFKELWDCQIIIDFRDPYSRDPRMVFSRQQREWLEGHEKRSVACVEAIVSVNSQCLELIAPEVETKRIIVNNGYDDSVVDRAYRSNASLGKGNKSIKLVYCGTIFRDLGLENLLEALNPEKHQLLHFGRDQTANKSVNSEMLESKGFIADKSQLVHELQSCDAGILRLGGESTTSTTKIFDYIACDLDIIIITDGKAQSGAVHEMTAGLDGVYWLPNDPKVLKEFMNTYSPRRKSRPERESFSRRHQTSLLLELILDD
ncbi:MAG TPA: hypothetical protein EYG51_24470 [Pseudomonadales bacterium]|nr:hypothetical protein [Pseudomonadales bacterium]